MVQKKGLSRALDGTAVGFSVKFYSEKGRLDGTTRFPKKFLRLDVWLKFTLNIGYF